MNPGSHQGFGVPSAGARVDPAPFPAGAPLVAGLLKYLRNICGEITPSAGAISICGWAGVTTAGFVVAEGGGAGGACFSGSAGTGGISNSGTTSGGGKTTRFVGLWNSARNRNGAGPTRRKYPGPVDAMATTPTTAMSTTDRARQYPARPRFMGLNSLFLKTVIQKGIGDLDPKLKPRRTLKSPRIRDDY